jgi:hypothetical protein
MEELMRPWLENLSQAAKEAAQQCGAEMKRLGVQGTTELASAIHQGSAFVPYGIGQDINRVARQSRGRDM